jgi:hypothetical protein
MRWCPENVKRHLKSANIEMEFSNGFANFKTAKFVCLWQQTDQNAYSWLKQAIGPVCCQKQTNLVVLNLTKINPKSPNLEQHFANVFDNFKTA